jgi:hypothetical protein
MVPYHKIWERRRYPHHGGAIRTYLRSAVSEYGRTSPESCRHCKQAQQRQKDTEQSSVMSGIKLDLLDEIDLSLQDPGYPTKGECLSCLWAWSNDNGSRDRVTKQMSGTGKLSQAAVIG